MVKIYIHENELEKTILRMDSLGFLQIAGNTFWDAETKTICLIITV